MSRAPCLRVARGLTVREWYMAASKSKPNGRTGGSSVAGGRGGLGLPVLVAAVVVALLVGALFGKLVLGGGMPAAAFAGQTSVSEADLGRVIATYTYDGKTETVTVRDAIESQASLDSVTADDGTYTLPSADAAIAVARNRILAKVAEDKGITVSDDELPEYVQKIGGASDIATLAQRYGLTEDEATEIVRESALMWKLKGEVTSTKAGDAPTAPEAPSDGNSDTANATYGAYVIGLLGDEWDSDNNTWARQDGPFYQALKDETFSADSATYAQAQTAYYVAYQQYVTNSQTSTSEWTQYVNEILSKASIQVVTLTA